MENVLELMRVGVLELYANRKHWPYHTEIFDKPIPQDVFQNTRIPEHKNTSFYSLNPSTAKKYPFVPIPDIMALQTGLITEVCLNFSLAKI